MFRDLDSLLEAIVANPQLHARWLNTFSYLEYVGFRKIVKSQDAQVLNLEILSHAVEEGRHALLLKKLAIKTGGHNFNTYSSEMLLCGTEAEDYFQGLDHACENLIENKKASNKSYLTYLYVTWLVEVRALSIYGSYQKALAKTGEKFPLLGLLAEEAQHLAAVEGELRENDPFFNSRSAEFKSVEEKLYQNYFGSLTHKVLGNEDLIAATQ